MNELKSNIKYQPTTVSGNTHYYQPDTFTGDNVFDNKIKIELKSQEELGKIIVEQVVKIHDLEYQLQAYKDKEYKLRELISQLTFENAIYKLICKEEKKVFINDMIIYDATGKENRLTNNNILKNYVKNKEKQHNIKFEMNRNNIDFGIEIQILNEGENNE